MTVSQQRFATSFSAGPNYEWRTGNCNPVPVPDAREIQSCSRHTSCVARILRLSRWPPASACSDVVDAAIELFAVIAGQSFVGKPRRCHQEHTGRPVAPATSRCAECHQIRDSLPRRQSGKQALNRRPLIHELHWPRQRRHHFFIRIDTKCMAQCGMDILYLDGIVLGFRSIGI